MSQSPMAPPRFLDVVAARRRLQGRIRRTPMDHSPALSRQVGAEVHLKWENLQLTGSFKVRGALNRLDALTAEERTAGVVTASSGNHAQGLAHAASLLGVPATIVVPENTPETKKAGVVASGADLVVHGAGYDDAEAHAHELAVSAGLTYIPSYEDPRVIAGQGTVGLEALLERPELEAIVVPAGGGGLIAGVALAAKAINPEIRIIGVQPEVSSVWRPSHEAGRIVGVPYLPSVADGLPGGIGQLNLDIALTHVDEFVLVSEDAVGQAVRWLAETHHQLVEGSGAVGVAAFQEGRLEHLRGQEVLLIVTGGNIDMDRFAGFLQG